MAIKRNVAAEFFPDNRNQEQVRQDAHDDYKRRKEKSAQDWEIKNNLWKAKQAVISAVQEPNKFRRWAYEIIALRDAGLYSDDHGIKMAESVIKKWEGKNIVEVEA